MTLTEQEQFTLDVITRNEFIVRVEGRDGDLLLVDYAGKLHTRYQLHSHDWCGIQYTNIDSNAEEFIDLPYIIFRLYVLLDIYRQCRRLNLPYSAVWYFSESGERSELKDLWQLSLDERENELEIQFNSHLQELFAGEPLNKFDDLLETEGLLHQFTRLKGLLL